MEQYKREERKEREGYHKYNWMSGGNKDHTAQPPREGESLSNRGGGSGRSSGQGWDGQRCSQLSNSTERVVKLDKSSVTCFDCQKLGHYRSECPEPRVRLSRIHSPDPTLPEGKTVSRVNEADCPTILNTVATRSAIPGRLEKKKQLTGSQVKEILGNFGGGSRPVITTLKIYPGYPASVN